MWIFCVGVRFAEKPETASFLGLGFVKKYITFLISQVDEQTFHWKYDEILHKTNTPTWKTEKFPLTLDHFRYYLRLKFQCHMPSLVSSHRLSDHHPQEKSMIRKLTRRSVAREYSLAPPCLWQTLLMLMLTEMQFSSGPRTDSALPS